MSTHSNPITNVTPKNRVRRFKLASSVVRTEMIEDMPSFLEMSMYKIKKYFKK